MSALVARLAVLTLLSTPLVAYPSASRAAGCLSGAAVGGVAGHFVGRHGLLGAAAGCAVGMHEKHVEERQRMEGMDGQRYQGRRGENGSDYAEPAYRENAPSSYGSTGQSPFGR